MKNYPKRDTVFQVIDNSGNVIYSHMLLFKCRKWVKKHFTFTESSGRGSYVTIEGKVTWNDPSNDYLREYFPKFESRSNGLFRRYVTQTIITPCSPAALVESKCVAYIINSFHENHLAV